MLTTAPRGTHDALPGKVEMLQHLERVFQQVAHAYGYREIRTPVFEHTELFEWGVGDTTDIVQKEMYTFLDKGGRSITLRPEGTAPVARALIEHKLYGEAQPTKFHYAGIPIFRYERPQSGRLRQHHQLGIEAFGSNDPKIDAEIIALLDTYYHKLGMKDIVVEINTVGCPKCRPSHREALRSFLGERISDLCALCQERFERNPMRILDCKNEGCQELTRGAPTVIEHVCVSCSDHYAQMIKFLELLDVSYVENPRLVRGLDYYTNTAFEFINNNLPGAEKVIGGGGRYNGLVEMLGGPYVPGIGFGAGVERIALALEAEGISSPPTSYCDVFFVTLGVQAEHQGVQWLQAIRQRGVKADMDYVGRGMKAQMKQASRLGARWVVIVGEQEVIEGQVVIRNMETKEQQRVHLSKVVAMLVDLAQ